MQDVNQTAPTDTHDNTTQDPAMTPVAGNSSSDAGGSPNTDMSDVEGASVGEKEDDEEE
ncbi:MAG TPA: hypothetical protein VGO07_07610 [Candidatus Saccharimonadales bacterium]|jgi:hypothetical protein|nr:hypothetical protein [Candidatus Saccharimonadales bacterium]